MKFLYLTLILSLFLGHITALPTKGPEIFTQRRSADTCGDPTLTRTYYQGFSPSNAEHGFNVLSHYVNLENGGDLWDVGTPTFRAWRSGGQPSTVPLYTLRDAQTTDPIFLTSNSSSAPSLSGYDVIDISAYVYPTQTCSSVPLYCATKPGDHWYNTNQVEHDDLVNNLGWSDCGITAYVLPIDDISEIVA